MTVWKDGIPNEWGYNRYGESPYDTVPEGWSILVSYDWAGDWEFEMVVVWRNDETGELRGAADSGCSCPTPFGDLALGDAKLLRSPDDLRSLVSTLDDEIDFDGTDPGVADLKAAVHRALRDKAATPNA